jgi:hypothetical protein
VDWRFWSDCVIEGGLVGGGVFGGGLVEAGRG